MTAMATEESIECPYTPRRRRTKKRVERVSLSAWLEKPQHCGSSPSSPKPTLSSDEFSATSDCAVMTLAGNDKFLKNSSNLLNQHKARVSRNLISKVKRTFRP